MAILDIGIMQVHNIIIHITYIHKYVRRYCRYKLQDAYMYKVIKVLIIYRHVTYNVLHIYIEMNS